MQSSRHFVVENPVRNPRLLKRITAQRPTRIAPFPGTFKCHFRPQRNRSIPYAIGFGHYGSVHQWRWRVSTLVEDGTSVDYPLGVGVERTSVMRATPSSARDAFSLDRKFGRLKIFQGGERRASGGGRRSRSKVPVAAWRFRLNLSEFRCFMMRIKNRAVFKRGGFFFFTLSWYFIHSRGKSFFMFLLSPTTAQGLFFILQTG